MKKLLTILLLISLAGQTSTYFHAQTYEVSITQEADEKAEKGGEEKREKEYVSHTSLSKIDLLTIKAFGFYCCNPSLSPVLDNHTPPPDVTL